MLDARQRAQKSFLQLALHSLDGQLQLITECALQRFLELLLKRAITGSWVLGCAVTVRYARKNGRRWIR